MIQLGVFFSKIFESYAYDLVQISTTGWPNAFGNALGSALVDSIQASETQRRLTGALDKANVPYSIDSNGNLKADANYRTDFEFLQGAVGSGATSDEAALLRDRVGDQIARINGLRNSLDEETYLARARNVFEAGLSTDSTKGADLVIPIIGRKDDLTPDGRNIIGSTVGTGLELIDKVGQLYSENERLATFLYGGAKAVLSGGAVKPIVLQLAKVVESDLVGQVRDIAVRTSEEYAESYATTFARNKNLSIDVSLGNQNFNLGPKEFGFAAKELVGTVVGTFFDYTAGDVAKRAENVSNVVGRTGKQQRLRDLMNNDKVSSADRGWLRNEQRRIDQGEAVRLRNPRNTGQSSRGGTELAHPRGQEAAKGNGYENAYLQDADLHRLQHKHDKYGRLNPKK